jgi:lipopolysaccharide/colanic/teichoic acid biosynthesis glycosyltransferase
MSFRSRQSVSRWMRSPAKRVFDTGCVVLSLPVLAPLALLVAASVRLTSRGPVLFRQKRVGRHGRVFTMLKFRTIDHVAGKANPAITTLNNQAFTSVGPLLRRWKLDELPQLINILLGDMSLVGPRPKMPEHTIFNVPCRPGLTGMATLACAEEEAVLSRVPRDQLHSYYYNVLLPAKHKLDSEYLARATLLSDVRILVKSALRQWDSASGDCASGCVEDFLCRRDPTWPRLARDGSCSEPLRSDRDGERLCEQA